MDASQFVERYRLIYRDLYRFALCMLGNVHDAEDAVSESVATGWEKRGQLRRASAFKSWMFQIAANCCRQKLRGGYTSREIGAIAKLNPATVRSRRMRALEKMERFLGGARS